MIREMKENVVPTVANFSKLDHGRDVGKKRSGKQALKPKFTCSLGGGSYCGAGCVYAPLDEGSNKVPGLCIYRIG